MNEKTNEYCKLEMWNKRDDDDDFIQASVNVISMTYALCSASRSRKLMMQVSHIISFVTD